MTNRIPLYGITGVELFLSAIFASFYLPVKVNGILVTLTILVGLILLIKHKALGEIRPFLLLFPVLFLFLLLGQLYTTDLERGWTLIERNLSLLLLPFALVGFRELNAIRWNRIFSVFTLAGITAGVVCLGIAIFDSWQAGSIYVIPNNTHFIYNRFMHHRLTDPIGMHAVYFSLFLSISVIWLLLNVLRKNSVFREYKMLLVFFLIALIYLMKSAIIACGLGLAILMVIGIKGRHLFFSSLRNKITFIAIGITILAGSAIAVNNKLEHFSLDYDIQNEGMSTLAIRMSLWECATDVVKQAPILGVGTGDSQHELRKVFEETGFTLGTKNDFNAHNMFLQYWMSNGIFAVITLTLIFFFSFRIAWKEKNILWVNFIVLFFLFCMTESTLRTQKGLLFFICFTTLMTRYRKLEA